MRIKVRLFALHRELLGKNAVSLDVPRGAKVKDLKPLLVHKFPALGKSIKNLAIVLNGSYSNPDSRLKDGDEIALIPPVSGG